MQINIFSLPKLMIALFYSQAEACWTYNEDSKECVMNAGCSTLVCSADSMQVDFDPMLFGYEQDYTWASDIKPIFENSTARFQFQTPLSNT